MLVSGDDLGNIAIIPEELHIDRYWHRRVLYPLTGNRVLVRVKFAIDVVIC